MSYQTIIYCICEMKDVPVYKAQEILAEEQAKGEESYINFLEGIGDWYFDL